MAAWIALLALALVFLGPLAGLLAHVDLAALRDVTSSASFHRSIWVTLASGIGGASASLVLGVLFARHFATREWRFKRLERLLLLIPYLVPNFILATAYVLSWNPATGLLNGAFRFPFGLYGLGGMTALFAIVHMPVVFLILEDKIKRIDGTWREAARLSGASSLEILWRVELPLLRPALVSAFSLCFALDISAFAIPAWIGAPEHAFPITYKIYQAIQVNGPDGIPEAAALSLLLFAFAIPPLLVGHLSQRHEKRYAMLSGKSSRQALMRGTRPVFQLLFWCYQLVSWMAPLACLFLSTLVKPGCLQSSGAACFADVSLRSYHYVLFELDETRAAFHGSLLYGGGAAIAILLLSVSALVAFSVSPSKRKFVEWVFSVPVATPGAVIALGLIVTCSGRFGINLYNTAWIVVVAFVLKHLNLAFQPLRTGASNISASLVEAARLSGASRARVWSKIVLPILRPECLGGFFLVLIPILGELTMSVFLSSPKFRSIGTVLFDLQDYADQASAAALSVVLVLMILFLNEAARLLSRGRLGY